MRELNEIIVHCSATRRGWKTGRSLEDQVEAIRRWHMVDEGWSDIGYHMIIGRDGRVLPGRAIERMGAHVRGHNRGTIGVCLIGGHGSAATDAPSEHFTPVQLAALARTIDDLCETYGIQRLRVQGHNHYAAKACPGFDVRAWMRSVNPGTCRECGRPLPVEGG